MEVSRGIYPRKWLATFFICIGLLIFISGLLTRDYGFCLFGILIGILYPFFSIWGVRYSAANKHQQFQQLYHSDVEIVTSFYDDHFDVHNMQDGADHAVPYPQVAKVYETKNLYFLMMSSRIGFMLEKQGFKGTTATEFGHFIRARAVGEGQITLKKKKRKAALIIIGLLMFSFSVGIAFGFLGDVIGGLIPRTFSHGNYSIRLTSAFEEIDDEWVSHDVTVYYFYETSEELSDAGSTFESAAAYLQDLNEGYGISSVVLPISDSRAWTTYTDKYEGNEYFNFDYVIMSDGDFWYTTFYCLEKDANKYKPLFEKWANTITVH